MEPVKFIPLSFINNKVEIDRQILNTIVFKQVFIEFKKVTTLGTLLLNTQYGYTASAKASGNSRLLRITDLKDNFVNWNKVPHCNCDVVGKYRLKGNDILVARTGGTTGKSFIVDKLPFETIFASYLIRMSVDEENNPLFVHMFLNSYFFWSQIIKIKRGSAQPNVNAQRMKGVKIPVCPKNVQDIIVDYVINGVNNTSSIVSKIKEASNRAFSTGSKLNNLSTEITHQQSLLKKLRQSILQDAISGKLTKKWRKENPDVEPASELLARIKAEKERLIKEKKVKKQKPLPSIREDEIPFELPEGWGWCRLGHVTNFITSGSRDWAKYYSDSGAIFLRMGNLSRDSFKLRMNKIQYVNPPESGEGKRTKLKENDILLSITGEVGLLGLIPADFGEAYINQHTGMVRLHPATYSKYFVYLFLTKLLKTQFGAPQRGMKNSFRLTDIQNLIVPIPPTDEKYAVVSEIEKLFAYCDKLEQQIGKSQQDSEFLMQAVLKEVFEG